MKTFDDLLKVADVLLGSKGCPWDKEQTFYSLQPYFIEEVYELIEAIDLQDPKHIIEESADLLYVIIFLAKIAEKEGIFTIEEILAAECEKLIRRHPHIFGDKEAKKSEEVLVIWQEVKKEEKKRKNLLDGIPPGLPTLNRAQKVLHKSKISLSERKIESEKVLGEELLALISCAEKNGIDAESALRRALLDLEKKIPEMNT